MTHLTSHEEIHYIQDRLKVIYLKRPGYQKKYAMITFPIGGLHRHYEAAGNVVSFPSGAAHFLEHKCFEDSGHELTEVFAQQGASVNAFTSYMQTSYLFEATDQLAINIHTLLRFVFFPNFTAAGVEEEKGIIKEEWAMYQDNPFYKQYRTLLETVYKNHPYEADIIGDEQSIMAMDYATLKAIHHAFYQPEAATLIISGDVDIEPLMQDLNRHVQLPPKRALRPLDVAPSAPPFLKNSHVTLHEDVYADYLITGYRLDLKFKSIQARYTYYLGLEVALDMLFDATSPWLEAMQDKGLINDGFEYDLTLYDSVALVVISTQTKDLDALKKAIHDHLHAPQDALSEARFTVQKKANIGAFMFSLDSLAGTVRNYARTLSDGLTPYDLLNMQLALTYEDVLAAYQKLTTSYLAFSVHLRPLNPLAGETQTEYTTEEEL